MQKGEVILNILYKVRFFIEKKEVYSTFLFVTLETIGAFRLVVWSSFVLPNNKYYWLKQVTVFVLANHSCCLQKQIKIKLHVERVYYSSSHLWYHAGLEPVWTGTYLAIRRTNVREDGATQYHRGLLRSLPRNPSNMTVYWGVQGRT